MRTPLTMIAAFTLIGLGGSPALAQTGAGALAPPPGVIVEVVPTPQPPAPVYAQPAPYAPQPAPAYPTYAQPAPTYAAPTYAPQPAPTYAPQAAYAPQPAPRAPAYAPQPTYGPRYDRQGRMIVGYRPGTTTATELWGPGIALFLAGWVLDFAVLTPLANSLSNDRLPAVEQDAWAWSLVPLVGPFVQLGISAPHPAIPILTGLMQIGGLVLFVTGLTTQRETQVPIYAFGDARDPRTARLTADVAPTDGGAYVSLSLTHL